MSKKSESTNTTNRTERKAAKPGGPAINPSIDQVREACPHLNLEELDSEVQALPSTERFSQERVARKDVMAVAYYHNRYPDKPIDEIIRRIAARSPHAAQLGVTYPRTIKSLLVHGDLAGAPDSARPKSSRQPRQPKVKRQQCQPQPQAQAELEPLKTLLSSFFDTRNTFRHGEAIRQFFKAILAKEPLDRLLDLALVASTDAEAQQKMSGLLPSDYAILTAAIAAAKARP
jgi:hypothetical protein